MTKTMMKLIEDMKNIEATIEANVSVNPFVESANAIGTDVEQFQNTTELYEIDIHSHKVKYA